LMQVARKVISTLLLAATWQRIQTALVCILTELLGCTKEYHSIKLWKRNIQ
jgi:hypothetical protein